MPDVEWREDLPADAERIRANLVRVGRGISAEAAARRAPTVAMALDWHRAIYAGTAVPIEYFAGQVRDSDDRYPELVDYEVRVGRVVAVRARDVPAELVRFETRMGEAVRRLDAAIPVGERPDNDVDLDAVIRLCAYAHGEWVRIHPFANGNGRTARLWAMWVAVRYGLPPFIRLKPRPDGLYYGEAAMRSMRDGDHEPTVVVFRAMLLDRLR